MTTPEPAESPMDRAYRNGATRIPEDLRWNIHAAINGGLPTGWPKFYDRDGEAWEATTYTHDGDTVMLPSAGDMEPMLRRDVEREYGALVTEAGYEARLEARGRAVAYWG